MAGEEGKENLGQQGADLFQSANTAVRLGSAPLQYQKDLRMIEARTLLEQGVPSVSFAGFHVG